MPYTLAYKDRYKRVQESAITSDTSDSIAFASIPDDVPTRLVAEWTGKQFTKLFSAIYMGANLMFPEEANEIIWQLVKVVHQPIPLDDEEEGGCINYLPSAPFVSYDPQNPYSQPDVVPEGYLVAPFHHNSDFAYPEIFGFLATDIMVAVDAIPVFGDWGDVLGLHFPTIKLRVFGEGQVELDLLSVQLGGYAVIKVGSPPNILDIADGIIDTGVLIIDLQADIESIPVESDLVIQEEIPINAPDGIDVYIVFIPKIAVSIDFFGMGGGIRQIGLCGLEMSGEAGYVEDVRFNTESCTFEKRVGGEWEMIVGGDSWLDCLPEGGEMATQEEIKQAIIDAAEQLAAQMISGQAGNVSAPIKLGKDGIIAIDTSGTEPEDDPATTQIDEFNAAKCGGVIAVEKGVNELLNYLYTLYGTDATPDVSAVDAQFLMHVKYLTNDTEMDYAVTAYYTERAASRETINSLSASALQNRLFRDGISAQSIKQYVLSLTGNTLLARQTLAPVIDGISQAQLEKWYESGLSKPSTLYKDYPSTPSPNEIIVMTNIGTTYNGVIAWKNNHRLEFTVEGYWVDGGDGDIADFWWYDTVAANPASRIANTSLQLGTGITKPTSAQVPYNTAHKYVFTIDTPAAAGSVQLNVSSSGMASVSSPTGGVTVTIRDLGEYLVA